MMKNKLIKILVEDFNIYNKNVLEAFTLIDREKFVPNNYKHLANENIVIPLFNGQTSTKPSTIARFLVQLKPNKEKTVLEIGTGSGYQTAILSKLYKRVVSYEIDPQLYQWAYERLKDIENVFLYNKNPIVDFHGGKFDSIIFSFTLPSVPINFYKALNENGILLAPILKGKNQFLLKAERKNDIINKSYLNYERFVMIRGIIDG